ncbi:hypothetical protein LCGC14_0776490 [marine sediment metagenome]|uniref:Uncharacterized protein n=1 Tax=marine sediment metagenome TaxID=412755 RepID=A0A0F9SGR7_9ZZZZ
MSNGLSWTAIAAIGIPLIGWMLGTSAMLAVGAYQLRRLVNNHLPHIEEQLDLLLRGEGLVCKQHEKTLEDHEERIRELQAGQADP